MYQGSQWSTSTKTTVSGPLLLFLSEILSIIRAGEEREDSADILRLKY